MPDRVRSIILRTDRPRLAGGLLYERLTGRAPVYSQAPVTMISHPCGALPDGAWVRVRSTRAGICGSDLKTIRLRVSTRAANQAARHAGGGPKFLGHETVGVVVEGWAACAWARAGSRVAMIPHTPCAARGIEPCAMCREGATLVCDHRDDPMPAHIDAEALSGGWSESFIRHESQLFPLPDDISDDQGVLLDPVACGAHCVLRRPPADGETVLVIGAGAIGLACIAAIRALGARCRIVVIARHVFQEHAALRAGATDVVRAPIESAYAPIARVLGTSVIGHRAHNRVLARGFDAVYDTVGSASSLHHALRWTRPRGAVVVEGVNLFPGPLDRTPIWHREIDILGALGHAVESVDGRRIHTFDLVAQWIRDGRLDPSWMITHRYPFDEFRAALSAASSKSASGAIKVVMEFPNP